MADTTLPERSPHPVDHVMAGHAKGLVNGNDGIDTGGSTPHVAPVPS